VTASLVLRGGILKLLNLPEILPVYLVDRLHLSVAIYCSKLANDQANSVTLKCQ